MARALHDPQRGYYARRIQGIGGQRGDFATVATLSPLLGQGIAAWIQENRRAMPKVRHVIEVGAGNGVLMETVRKSLGWWQRRRFGWHIVETSEALREQQKQRLGKGVTWHSQLETALEACSGAAFIYHNELLDAFPVRLVQCHEGEWQEVFVEFENGRAREFLRPLEVTHGRLPSPNLSPHDIHRADHLHSGERDQASAPLAPAVHVANTHDLFRGEGWGEGNTLPRFARAPTPHLTSPRNASIETSTPPRGERDQASDPLAPAVHVANTSGPFRGEGWGEGNTLPQFDPAPPPHLTSPRHESIVSSTPSRGERDQASGPLAQAVHVANTSGPFRGEGWGEGNTLPQFDPAPPPHLTSPRNASIETSTPPRGERDQASGPLTPAVHVANTSGPFRGEGRGEGETPPQQLASKFSALAHSPRQPQQRCELHESVREWLHGWVPEWKSGAMLTVDYGDTFPALYHRRSRGTLRAYLMHQRLEGMSIYENAGRQDITADVNFTDYRAWAAQLGIEEIGYATQAEFLQSRVPGAGGPMLDPDGAGGAFKVVMHRRVEH
jgi:SAM-dependent MidA family methyltransferase